MKSTSRARARNLVSAMAFIALAGGMPGIVWGDINGWPSRYDGEVIDINQIHRPSDPYPNCERLAPGGTTDPKALISRQACERGNVEARILAERFGQGNGRVLGILMGTTRGIYNAYDYSRKDGTLIEQGRLSARVDVERARTVGREAARGDAEAYAQSHAIDRFEAAVAQGTEPVETIDEGFIQRETGKYQGVSDGYRHEGLPERSERELLDEALRTLGSTPQWHDVDSTTIDGLGEISFWDLFSKRGRAKSFAEIGWNNRDRAWRVWLSLPNRGKADYDNLADAYTTVRREYDEVDPVTGQPRRVIRDEQVRVITGDEQRYHWEEGFKGSYAFYISHYFSLGYHQNLQAGYENGLRIGEATGRFMALQTGTIRGYNESYQAETKAGYLERYRESYVRKFEQVYDDYLNNPKIQLTGIRIYGQDDADGIYTPGEWLTAEADVINLGGVGKTVDVQLQGTIEAGGRTEQQSVPRLKQVTLRTGPLAQISRALRARQPVDIALSVDGLSLNWRGIVNRPAEIESVDLARLEPVFGRGQVVIRLVNPAKTPSPANLLVRVSITGIPTIEMNVPALEASVRNKVVTVPFSDLDPLELIRAGQVRAQVSVLMGNEELHSGVETAAVPRKESLAHLFHALVHRQISGLEEPDWENRLSDVQDLIFRENQEDVAANTERAIWEQDPAATMAGQVARNFRQRAPSNDGAIRESANAQYTSMGRGMWPLRERLDKGAVRASYSSVILEFAPTIEVKKIKK